MKISHSRKIDYFDRLRNYERAEYIVKVHGDLKSCKQKKAQRTTQNCIDCNFYFHYLKHAIACEKLIFRLIYQIQKESERNYEIILLRIRMITRYFVNKNCDFIRCNKARSQSRRRAYTMWEFSPFFFHLFCDGMEFSHEFT